MNILQLTLGIFLFLSICISEIKTLKCYECNTAINETCRAEKTFIVDCESRFNNATMVKSNDYDEALDSGNLPPSSIEISAKSEFYCLKTKFYIQDWKTETYSDLERKTRMTKPRVSYSCGYRVNLKNQKEECITKNSREILQTQCFCSTDLCNSGHFSVSISETSIITMILFYGIISLF